MGAFSCQLCQFPGVHNVPNCHGRPAVQCGRNAWLGDGNCLLLHDLKIHRPGRAMERRDENLSQLKWMAFVIQHDLATYFLKGLCYSHSKSVGCLLGFSTATAGWFGFPILSSNELLLDMSYLPSWKNIIAAWNHVNHVYKHTYIYIYVRVWVHSHPRNQLEFGGCPGSSFSHGGFSETSIADTKRVIFSDMISLPPNMPSDSS